jgi:hypothetical protein
MKYFFIFLLIVLIAAMITAPSQEKFNKYLAKDGKNIGVCFGANSVRYDSYKFFSVNHVDYCEPGVSINGLKPLLGVKSRTDKYLGLFGTFWKL